MAERTAVEYNCDLLIHSYFVLFIDFVSAYGENGLRMLTLPPPLFLNFPIPLTILYQIPVTSMARSLFYCRFIFLVSICVVSSFHISLFFMGQGVNGIWNIS